MARIVVSGHEQDFALGMPVAKCYCEFNSIHGVHYYVAEQMVEWLNGRKLNCSLGAVGSDCREAMDIQNLCEGVGNYFVVVDNQYLGLLSVLITPRLRWRCCWRYHKILG